MPPTSYQKLQPSYKLLDDKCSSKNKYVDKGKYLDFIITKDLKSTYQGTEVTLQIDLSVSLEELSILNKKMWYLRYATHSCVTI